MKERDVLVGEPGEVAVLNLSNYRQFCSQATGYTDLRLAQSHTWCQVRPCPMLWEVRLRTGQGKRRTHIQPKKALPYSSQSQLVLREAWLLGKPS
jgi:hypothetical protein